jgi:signal transduction histidine kinase
LGLLVAQVAHEIRNPLAGIYSTVQLWERLPDQARTPESMQSVKNAVGQLNTLLSKLLYFSKTDMNERGPVDLNRLVRETFELVRAQAAQQDVELRMELDSKLPSLSGSASALRQVVLNLSTNALQAMPGGGRLTCLTRSDSVRSQAVLEVIDTGSGIDPEIRARLFEPFFTTRPHGTGLGLARWSDRIRSGNSEWHNLPYSLAAEKSCVG